MRCSHKMANVPAINGRKKKPEQRKRENLLKRADPKKTSIAKTNNG